MINNLDNNNNIVIKSGDNRIEHKCPNCPKMCLGKQCSECHNKMFDSRKGNCDECGEEFCKVRPDGSIKKRCKVCSDAFTAKYFKPCPDCGKTYKALIGDDTTYDKCFDCYTGSKCTKCDCKSFGKTMCKDCYLKDKTSTDEIPLKKCSIKTCNKQTKFFMCTDCFNFSNMHTISTCQNQVCSVRYKGSYKYCSDCSKNNRSR